MADGVQVNTGSGPVIACDQLTDGTLGANIQVQYVKVMDGTYDSTNKLKVSSAGSVAAQVTDGTNAAAIKAGSTSPGASDPALVVGISPNSVNQNGQTTAANSAPVVLASDGVVLNKVQSQDSGLTDTRVNAAASNNATSLKASAGNIFEIDLYNAATYPVFAKFYNKASAPAPATDNSLLVWTAPIAAGTRLSRSFAYGFQFSTGIAYAITKLQSDTDNTSLVAGDVTGFIGWK